MVDAREPVQVMDTPAPAPASIPVSIRTRPRRKLLPRLLLWVALPSLLLLGLIYGGSAWLVGKELSMPRRTDLSFFLTPAAYGLSYESVTFPSRDGSVALKGWYLPSDPDRGVIVIVHGLSSSKAGFLGLAKQLRSKGFGVFLFDLRGHGESGDGMLSGGQFEQEDVLGAFDELQRLGVPPGRIGFLGFSLGAASSLLAAGQEPLIRAVAADSAFTDIKSIAMSEASKRLPTPGWVARTLLAGVSVVARLQYGINLNGISPESAVRKLAYPLLLVQGTADQDIPAVNAVELKAAARNPDTQLWMVDGASHVRSYSINPDEYVKRVVDYFASRFRATCPTETVPCKSLE